MTTIHADEMQPGDVIVYNGHSHNITLVVRRDGWAWPVAADGTGWAMASMMVSSTSIGHRDDSRSRDHRELVATGGPCR